MKKNLIAAVCLSLVVVGYVGLRVVTAPTPGVTIENFNRLYKGMSIRDVERLFGGPGEKTAAGQMSPFWPVGGYYFTWSNGEFSVVILPDRDSVYSAYARPGYVRLLDAPPSTIDLLLRFLKLR